MSQEKRLEGKVALVTGGARGIGKAICTRLAAEGAALAIVDIMLDVAQATADEFKAAGVNARAYAANVAKFEEAEKTVAAVVADFGKLDILVNNAGITKDTLMLKMTEDMWDAVIAVNLKGTFNFTKAAVRPMMKQRAGKIVNIASVVGRMNSSRTGRSASATRRASSGATTSATPSVSPRTGLSRRLRIAATSSSSPGSSIRSNGAGRESGSCSNAVSLPGSTANNDFIETPPDAVSPSKSTNRSGAPFPPPHRRRAGRADGAHISR